MAKSNFSLKRLWTAGVSGSFVVRSEYQQNLYIHIGVTVGAYLLYLFLQQWHFKEFDPFVLWNLFPGQFFSTLVSISLPITLFAFTTSLLSWFNDHSNVRSSLAGQSIGFKTIISIGAGVCEELNHRGLFIYFGLLVVFASNEYYYEILGLVFIVLALALVGKLDVGFMGLAVISVIAYFAHGWFAGWIRGIFPENPGYATTEFFYSISVWIADLGWGAGAIFGILMLVFTLYRVAVHSIDITWLGLIGGSFIFGVWAAYAYPLGVYALADIPLVPEGADKWTALLFLGAAVFSNEKFQKGHQYQGEAGKLNSGILGLYMFYITFNYGLVYAIVLHFWLDFVLLGTNHVIQVIQNRKKTDSDLFDQDAEVKEFAQSLARTWVRKSQR